METKIRSKTMTYSEIERHRSTAVSMNPEPTVGRDLFLGVDVGGTDVKVGLVDAEGRIVAKQRTSTPALKTPASIFRYALQFADEQLEKPLTIENSPGLENQPPQGGRLAAVGLAVPGVLDSRRFILREVVNLPDWLGVPLLEELMAASSLPSVVVNDANAAAFAEHARRQLGDQSLALVTLGTGIGCGVVMRGQPYGGDHGCAGELGHIAIDFGEGALPCTCGSRGHLESYAGSGGVLARLRRRMQDAPSGAVPERLRGGDLSPRDLAEEAEAGNALCRTIIDETAHYVGCAIGLLGQTLDPAVVLLGGAMTFGGASTRTGHAFLEGVRRAVKATTLVQVGGNMSIEFASLGNDAGVLGAATFAKQASGK